jgi:F0F1-type ATP synthase assembly protein I
VKKRTREYVLLVIVVLVAMPYGWLTREWGVLAVLGGMAPILAVVAALGMPWVESAPDGAWRRRPQA